MRTIADMNTTLRDIGLPGYIALGFNSRLVGAEYEHSHFICNFGTQDVWGCVWDETWDKLIAKARKWVANQRLCEAVSK